MNLEKILNHIRQTAAQSNSGGKIDENDILKYVEGRLENHRLGLMNAFLAEHPDIAEEMTILRKMLVGKPEMTPPAHVHKKVLRVLGLAESGLMEIILKKTGSMFDILRGRDYRITLSPQLVVRSGGDDELVFQTEKSPYFILCHIEQRDDPPSLYFSLKTRDNARVNNGRFRVRKGDQRIFEIVTDKMGITPPQTIHDGEYEIDVEVNKEQLGIIRLSLQP